MTSFTAAAASRKCEDNREQSEKEDTSNESSQEHRSEAQRILAEAIEQEKVGLDGLPAARFQLLRTFGRIERLGEQIDKAFGGQAFFQNLPPDCPANRRRFNAYFGCLSKVAGLLLKAMDIWMLTCGMKREDDWVPLLIAQMQLDAAKLRANPNQGDVMGRLRAKLASESF